MKKLLFFIIFLVTIGAVKAQETRKTDRKMKDCVMMKEGKMVVMKDGKTTAMDKEMTLADGTRVMSDGKVMMTDGSTRILKDGESLPLEGKEGKNKKKEPSR